MKYIFTSVLAILGIFFIVIGTTAPATLALVSTSQSNEPNPVPLYVMNSYPSTGSQNLPQILPNIYNDTVYVVFTTGYFTTNPISLSYVTGTFWYRSVNITGTNYGNYNIETSSVDTSIVSREISGTTYYGAIINLTYNFVNPSPGNYIEYLVGWRVTGELTYIVPPNGGLTVGLSANYGSTCIFGTPPNIYPGYFTMLFSYYPFNYTAEWWNIYSSTHIVGYLNTHPNIFSFPASSPIHINLPSNASPTQKFYFYYNEYNSSGPSEIGWLGAQIRINNYEIINISSSVNESISDLAVPPAQVVSVVVHLSPGTNIIKGFAIYSTNYISGQHNSNNVLIQVMNITVILNIGNPSGNSNTGNSSNYNPIPPTIPSAYNNNKTTQSYFEIGIGAVLLVGAVFTGRRRL